MTELPPKEWPNAIETTRDFGVGLGERLRTLLLRKGGSFDSLAIFSGLGRKKLDRLAQGETVPTISQLWKLANALGVPFCSLISSRKTRDEVVLRKAAKQVIASTDGRFTTRALLPHDDQRPVEFYELTIAPSHVEESEAHGAGTRESVVVARGHVEIVAGKERPQRLEEGDAMVFDGDVPHSYRNLGSSEAVLYLVMSYMNFAEN